MYALAPRNPLNSLNRIFIADIHHVIGSQFFTEIQARIPRAGQNHGLCAQGLADGNPHEPDGARSGYRESLSGNQSPQGIQSVHGGSGGDDQSGLFVTHMVRNMHQRIDMIDGIFGKCAVGCKSIGAVAFSTLPIIHAVV
jgi:hypothetical protein